MNFSRSIISFCAVLALTSVIEAAVNPAAAGPLAASVSNTSLAATPGALTKLQNLQQRVIDFGRCNPNVCFALDGSGSISLEDYRAQKEFVEFIAAIVGVDEDAEFSAVQYGLRNIGISPLTGNVNRFLRKVSRSSLNRAPRTFIAAGLGYCIRQLRRRPGDANKIVLLGDGRSNFGGNPVPVAQKFLPPQSNGAICSVGVGFQDTSTLQAIAGGDPTRVLAIDGYFELLDILDVLVEDICGFEAL